MEKLGDSLLNRISVTRDKAEKLDLYVQLMQVYYIDAPSKGMPYVDDALALAKEVKSTERSADLYYSLGILYWRSADFKTALYYDQQALEYFKNLGDKKRIAGMYSRIAQDYVDQSLFADALASCNLSLQMYAEMDDAEGQAGTYLLLAFVYEQLGNSPEGANANYQALKFFEAAGNEYGVSIAASNLADLYVRMGKYEDALNSFRSAGKILEKKGDLENGALNYISIGQVYVETRDYDKAIQNFRQAIEVGGRSFGVLPIAYGYANIAKVYRVLGMPDSVINNYLKAEEYYREISNNRQLAMFYNEVSSFYIAVGNKQMAQLYIDKSAACTKDLEDAEVLEGYYRGLQSLDSLRGDWKDAYFNYRQYIIARDSVSSAANLKGTMQAVMQLEYDKKEAIAKAEQEKKDIQQRNIRNFILTGLAGSLIFLLVVYRQRNKIAVARKRSDQLLLNILPQEVADELKEKGEADARLFDMVTVMFTDFKGFTQIAEKLTPKELVSEIHYCFKAFDDIIERHNIEKIKTIGDAYMCAGGLPVANTTHAHDVVSAALEIQAFMQHHMEVRRQDGKPIFEIRIGVHTGPVVAGIVGVKKFAYDIWGDTVNIASRMESSGEVGKVNISGETYEHVKDVFNCVYRGKVAAKNKGEIDMYFVDHARAGS